VKLGLAHDWRRRATAGQGMATIRDERARVNCLGPSWSPCNSLYLKGIVATVERREEISRKCLQVDMVL